GDDLRFAVEEQMRKAAEIASAFAPREALNAKTSFFLVGIGGAGMSALARMLKHRGFLVKGTDSTLSPEVERLRSEGFEVKVGHSGDGIQPEDAVVLTDAIDLDNSPEVRRAKELDIPLFRRSQALGWLLKPYKVIAVTGTHGKTTTTGLTGAGLIAAGLDPTVVVGASIPEWGGPVREGKGEWAVVEACEAYDAYNDIDPTIVVLTNLELDHVDFHGTWENLKGSVGQFVGRIPSDGVLVYCAEDSGAKEIAADFKGKKIGYDLKNRATPPMKLPGRHNHLNMWAAVEAGVQAGGQIDKVWAAMQEFTGAERRLQVLRDSRITVIDDYAHHPTEVTASLQAIRERLTSTPQPPSSISERTVSVAKLPSRELEEGGSGRLIVAFQPHLYSRTADNMPEFAKALDEADVVFITDIYPAREDPIPGVSSARIAELVTKECHYVPSRHLLPRTAAAFAREGDVVVGMGAGTIGEFAPDFIKEWERRKRSIGFQPIASEGILPSDSGERGQDGRAPHRLEADATTIAVIYGGDSSEREVSILSGREVHESLVKQGFNAELIDVTDILLSKGDLSRFSGTNRPDLAFLAVHGTNSEDGAYQGLFEMLHIPYTGSGIQASAIAMDKALTKQVLGNSGIRVPAGRLVRSLEEAKDLKTPAVVKPNAEGSTVGLTFVETQDQLEPAVRRALTYGGACLVEEWVRGMEISVPVLGDRALLPVEIAPASGRYDFASKYTPGATEEIVPARLPENVLSQVQEIALKAHNLLGCQGATRTDMMIAQPGNEPYVLEVNTLPGMTSTSLLPNSAMAAGIDFDALVLWLVEDAMRRYAKKA
ncbi:MAG: D-alanine--D-alanine ligase, partial [Chlorobia bacterium]|nr:D-alanine--D-alanine ligase [Fimbriimonadaceae bacterium]